MTTKTCACMIISALWREKFRKPPASSKIISAIYPRKPLFNNGMFPTETSRALALLAKLNIFVSQAVPSRLMNKSSGVGALVSHSVPQCTCVPTINYYNIGSGWGRGDTEVHREEQTLRRTQGLPGRS